MLAYVCGRRWTEIVARDAGYDYKDDCRAVEEDCLEPAARLVRLRDFGVVHFAGGRLRMHGRGWREVCAVQASEAITEGG